MNLYYTLGYRLVRKMLICNRDGNKPTSSEFDSPNTENSKSEARNPIQAQIIKIQNRTALFLKICIWNLNIV